MKSISIIRGKIVYNRLSLNRSVFIDLLSGFFPKIMKRKYCRYRNTDCRICEINNSCSYSYIFEPFMSGDKSLVVSLPDIKIPFAFKWFLGEDGGEFILSMFGGCSIYVYEILQTLVFIGEAGLGHEKMKFAIGEIESLDPTFKKVSSIKLDSQIFEKINPIKLETVGEIASLLPSLNMKIKFISEYDLMRSKRDIGRNELFSTLYKRIRDRMKALYVLYLDEELSNDLKGLNDKTKDVVNVSVSPDILEFKGKVSYFRYLFLLGSYFNIGRRCAFGKGAYRII